MDPKSPFATQIKSARAQFESKHKPDRSNKEIKGHVVIRGIGFFSRVYGKQKEEVKGNLIQLHPVLNIEWLETPTREFTSPAETEKKPEKTTTKSAELNPSRKSPPPVKRLRSHE